MNSGRNRHIAQAIFRRHAWMVAFLILAFACLSGMAFADSGTPVPLRHYDFSAASSAADPIPDKAGSESALTFDPGPGGQKWELVPGPSAGQKAIRLDQGSLTGTSFPVAKAFTVTFRCRLQGMGAMRGNSGATNGMLLSSGTGYWDGWRVTVSYPEARIGFEIGRPQPSSSVGVYGGALPSGVWQQVAASWDGRTMRIFLNGLPVASAPYEGAYTPASPFKIGYAGSGVGSLRLDVAEMTAYDQALEPLVLLEQANAFAALPASFQPLFRQALTARLQGDFSAAAVSFRSLALQAAMPPVYRDAARMGLADAYLGLGQPTKAIAEYAGLLSSTTASKITRQEASSALMTQLAQGAAGSLSPQTFERLLAMPGRDSVQRLALLFGYARSLRVLRAYPAAQREYSQILSLPDLRGSDRWNADLQQIQTLRAGGDLKAAHTAALKLARLSGAPPQYGSIALLAVARSAAQGHHYALARDIYREASQLPNIPQHHEAEAYQGMLDADRLIAGHPALDPAEHRMHLPPAPKPAAVFYVSAGGSDAHPGTKALPFATFSRARDAIRAIRHAGLLPAGGVRVIVRGGSYPMTTSFALDAADSGTARSPIIYEAAEGETPTLTGAVRLSGFVPVTDPEVLARLPQEARSHVLQTDLSAVGITDFGKLQPHGFGQDPVPIAELFFDGKPMTLARWPNSGFALTGKVTAPGAGSQAAPGREFEYPGEQPAHWAKPSEAWLYGYWEWDWADNNVAVTGIDPAAHRFQIKTPPDFGIRPGQRFYAYNVLEELDTPGEWYLDRSRGRLYFYPPGDIRRATVQFSVLNTPLVTLTGVSSVTFRGLTLEGGRGAGLTTIGGADCLLAACTIRRCGGDAVIIDGGFHHGVLSCDLYTLGRGGVRMTGGDRKTLTPGRHFVENCDIYDFSRLDRTYTPAVLIEGVGNRIAFCHLHDAPHHAIRLEGNNHLIEFNEVDHVVTEADDQGGLDMWFNPSYRGNVFRDNFWHDIGSGHSVVGQAGVRLDDAISGTLVYQNVFLRCSGGNFGGVQINGGKDNWIDNNLFIDCKTAVSIGFWGEDGWASFLRKPDVIEAVTKAVDIHSPPYSTSYPALAHLGENAGANMVWRNLVINCGQLMTGDDGRQSIIDNYLTGGTENWLDPHLWAQTGFVPIPLSKMGLYRDTHSANSYEHPKINLRL